jgi:quercetin dioxygenase-like cupin family protein
LRRLSNKPTQIHLSIMSSSTLAEFEEQQHIWLSNITRNTKGFAMSNQTKETRRVVDVRSMPPPSRHNLILRIFDEMAPGETMLVVNDHEPVHLVRFMKHERRNFDADSYQINQRGPAEWVGVFKKKAITKSDNTDGIIVTSFEKERSYDAHAFSPIPIYATNNYRVILTYFKAGQFIPVHTPNIDLVFLVQSGTGEVIAANRRIQIKPGVIVIIPRGQSRGIKAETDMEALHLVSPPPNDADHEEVAKKLQLGRFE